MDDSFSEDQQVLDALAADGHDLDSEMTIDFFFLAADEESANEMAEALRAAGHEAEVEYDEEGCDDEGHDHADHEHEPLWAVVVSVDMVPRVDVITRLQGELGALVAELGGEPDGWGTVGNLPEDEEGEEGEEDGGNELS